MSLGTFNKKKNITLVIDAFGSGGIQQAYIILINEYVHKFQCVHLIILTSKLNEISIRSRPNLFIHRLNAQNFFELKTYLQFKKICMKSSSEIFIASIYRAQIWAALAKPKSSKLIWVEHNTYFFRSRVQWLVMKLFLSKVDKIVAVSNEVKSLTQQYLQKSVEVIPNPSTFKHTVQLSHKRNNDFVFIGRLVYQKNPELMLKSYAEFLQRYDLNSKLHVVGNGELLNEIELLRDKLGLQGSCILHKEVSIEKVKSLLLKVKTLVSTSRIEGMGIVRLEAFTSGCCVVTTNTGGTHLFTSLSDNGLFVSQDNKEDISKKMYESISQRYWTTRQVRIRSAIIEGFNPKIIATELITL